MRIEITGMTYGANAVGRADDGKVVFVAGGAPGDVVEVETTRETKGFREGSIIEFYEKGAARVEAPCPFAAVCGGCPWMHLSYESQLQSKRASVVSQLSKIGGIPRDRAEELVGECVGSKRQLGYRNKLELAGGRDERGLFMLGFHERGGKLAAAPKTCLLAAKGIEKAPGHCAEPSLTCRAMTIWAFSVSACDAAYGPRIPKSRSGRTLQHFPEKPQRTPFPAR